MDLYEKILEDNKIYDEQIKWLEQKKEKIRQDIIKKNEDIDLDELKELSFSEIKIICSIIKNRVSDKKFNEIWKIREQIKAETYPDLLGVHYYKELKKISYLSEELKIKIDKALANNYRKSYIEGLIEALFKIDNRLINDLCKLNIIEKRYRFKCECYECDFGVLILKEKDVIKYKEFWEKELNGNLKDYEGEDINYGVINVDCENGYGYEISSLEEFNSHKKNEYYIVSKKPDTTLDDL